MWINGGKGGKGTEKGTDLFVVPVNKSVHFFALIKVAYVLITDWV